MDGYFGGVAPGFLRECMTCAAHLISRIEEENIVGLFCSIKLKT